MLILDGQKLNSEIASTLREAISHLNQKPTLLIIQIGQDLASNIYINKKKEFAEKIGADVIVKNFSDNVAEAEIITEINQSNLDPKINGIIIQLPIPKNLNQNKILQSVSANKDVDGLGLGKDLFIPATTKGIITLLEQNKIKISKQKIVIINDSDLVGKPTAYHLSKKGAETIICNEQTLNLREVSKTVDILITAIGQPEIIDEQYLKDDQVVIDVGISKTANGVKGDLKNDLTINLKAKTPVPGGVGPMTVASLFENLLIAHKMQN